MINLITQKERTRIRKEYYLRLFTVISIMFSILTISAMIPLVISYFIVSSNFSYLNEVSAQLSESESFRETADIIALIKDTNRKITLINNPMGTTKRENLMGVFSSVFQKALKFESKIKINSLVYEQVQIKKNTNTSSATTSRQIKESGIHKVYLRGKAETREVFSGFLKELERDKNFASIDSPVSNLINSNDIDFNLIMTLKDKNF